MAGNYVFSDIEALIKTIRNLTEDKPDRVWVTGVTGKLKAKAPTTKTKDAILSVDHHFDGQDLFVGNTVSALLSGGGMFLLHVSKDCINPDLLREQTEGDK